VSRRIKEFYEIADYSSLDELIGNLVNLRDRLPADAEPEMKLRGDDVFGRTITISYFRAQTAEEEARDRRYEVAAGGSAFPIRMVA
jgi:hypothetical protein